MTTETQPTVRSKSPVVLLARIVDHQGKSMTPNQVAAIEYTVSRQDEFEPHQWIPVVGHNEAVLTASSVLFAELQKSSAWTQDDFGYNFCHELDESDFEAFAVRAAHYQIQYQLTPVGGPRLVFRYLLRTMP